MHMNASDRQIEDTQKRLDEVKALQQTLLAVDRELATYHDLLSRELASLEAGRKGAAAAVIDGKQPSAAVPGPVRAPAPAAPSASNGLGSRSATPLHYYVSRLSPKTGKNQASEIEESAFPAELRRRRPDQDDALSTKMAGYAMERVWGRFQREILGGCVVYSIISDDWRLLSWLKSS